jgi:DNA uptake protein ComE-like DNA-binding protein
MRIIISLWNSFRRQLRQLFGFSRAETNGIVALLGLLWVLFTIPALIRWYEQTHGKSEHIADIALLDSLVAELETSCAEGEPYPSSTAAQGPYEALATSPQERVGAQKPSVLLDINTAEAQQLQRLVGLGPNRAATIVKYRYKLGGFIQKAQYQEIYGLNARALKSLQQYTYIDPAFCPRKINVNQADFKALLSHPYLSYEQVKAILNLRRSTNGLQHIDQLLTEGVLDTLTFERIKPYLAIEG